MENMEQLHRNWCHACKDWSFHISTVLFTISVMHTRIGEVPMMSLLCSILGSTLSFPTLFET